MIFPKQFNKEQEGKMRIAPENTTDNIAWLDEAYSIKTNWLNFRNDYAHSRIKMLHCFNNQYYNAKIVDQTDERIKAVENI